MERMPNDENNSELDTYGGERDITDAQMVGQMALAYFERQHALAPERARKEAYNVSDVEQGFLQQRKRDAERGRETSEEEFLKWERECADGWSKMLGYIHDAGMSTDMEAQVELPVFFTTKEDKINQTIEAESGNYFSKRSKELYDAINASDADSETKKNETQKLSSFFRLVMDHVMLRYMESDDIREVFGDETVFAYTYNDARTKAHNLIIERLNVLNGLARKYGTTPFTPRDFWTSDRSNQTPEVARRMMYDRLAVQAYYTKAFGDPELEQEAKRRLYEAHTY